jgi:holin-like protein
MKYTKEVLWIMAFTFLGEVLNALLPLPVPAGVYGMLLLLLALIIGVVKLPDIEGAGNILLDTMSIMFIPAAVGIMNAVDILKPVLLPYIVIIVVSTVLVMSVTGLVAQAVLRRKESTDSQRDELSEISLEPHETYGIGRRPLSPHGEMDGANGYADALREKADRAGDAVAEAFTHDHAAVKDVSSQLSQEADVEHSDAVKMDLSAADTEHTADNSAGQKG